jgi:hypothetical protein
MPVRCCRPARCGECFHFRFPVPAAVAAGGSCPGSAGPAGAHPDRAGTGPRPAPRPAPLPGFTAGPPVAAGVRPGEAPGSGAGGRVGATRRDRATVSVTKVPAASSLVGVAKAAGKAQLQAVGEAAGGTLPPGGQVGPTDRATVSYRDKAVCRTRCRVVNAHGWFPALAGSDRLRRARHARGGRPGEWGHRYRPMARVTRPGELAAGDAGNGR